MHCIFFIFWGFLLLYILFLCMDGSGIWTSWSVSLCPSSWLFFHLHSDVCILTHFAFAVWFLTVRNWKSSIRGSFPSPSRAAAHSPWQLGLQLRGLGSSLFSWAWRGFILLIGTCWSLSACLGCYCPGLVWFQRCENPCHNQAFVSSDITEELWDWTMWEENHDSDKVIRL